MKKIIFAFILIFLIASSAWASKTVPGDVLVIFKNPSENKITTASLASEGEHNAYLASVASEMDAEVKLAYDTFSENSNELFVLLHSETKSEQELLKEVLARPDVKGAQLNYIAHFAAKTPNDKYYSRLWGMEAINAPEVWENTTGSSNVYVAVLDSGIDSSHTDLAANIATEYSRAYVVNSDGTVSYNDNYQDAASIGHGTHVSGIIGAVGNNGEGVAGVNWTTKIIMFKTVNSSGDVPASLVIAALQRVVELVKQGVNIAAVNMSFDFWISIDPSKVSNSSEPYWAAMKAVSDAGVILCVAAGNENQAVGVPAPSDDYRTYSDGTYRNAYSKGEYVYPASFLNINNMIVVAAASQDVNGKIIRSAEKTNEAHSNYSSTYVHITAPGSHIVSTTPNNYNILDIESVEDDVVNYASWAGTSMAAPHVAGAVGLLKAAYPNATGAQIKNAILKGANGNYCKNDKNEVTYDDPSLHTIDNTSKYGFLDVKGAYDKLETIIKAQTQPSESDYTVTTDVDSKYLTNSSSTLSNGWRIVPIKISLNGNTPQVGDLFYVWLTSTSSSSVKTAADSTPYVSYVKTAGQLDIDVDNIYENDGETKASIASETYEISYRSEDGTTFVGKTSAVKLASTDSSNNNSSSGGGGGGCDLMRNSEFGIRNVLILCALVLLSFGAIKIKRS